MTNNLKTNQKQSNAQVGRFNDKRLSFAAFKTSATSAVPVEVKYSELVNRARALWAVDDVGAELTAQMPVLIYKLDGEYVVLSNWPKVEAFLKENENLPEGKSPGVLKARLVSKQLLKHIETVSVSADKQNEKASAVERDIEASHRADRQEDERPRWDARPQQRPYVQRDPSQETGNRQPYRPPARRTY